MSYSVPITLWLQKEVEKKKKGKGKITEEIKEETKGRYPQEQQVPILTWQSQGVSFLSFHNLHVPHAQVPWVPMTTADIVNSRAIRMWEYKCTCLMSVFSRSQSHS